MNGQVVRAVLRKELRDNLRDRRSMTWALMLPLLGAALFVMMMTLLMRLHAPDAPLVLPVAGGERAPNLVAFLRRAGATIETAPADYEMKVRTGALALTLVIPESYGKDFSAGRTAQLELVVDNSRNETHAAVGRAKHLLQAYGAELGALRLYARGISPALATPITVEELDLATPEKMAGFALGIIPMFLLMTAFMGGMYLAIDATAGERERGSLEPLLLNPVTRWELLAGKWLAVVITTFGALALGIAAFSVTVHLVPLERLGIRAELGGRQIAYLVAVLTPLAVMAAAGQLLISLFARTYKEAQTYLSILLLIPTLPASLLSLSPVKPQLWMMMIPMWGQALMLNDTIRGEPISLVQLALAAGAATLCTVAFLAGGTRMLGREAIVFGRTQAGS